MMQTQTSVFNPLRKVTLDPYGPNPLEEDMKGSPAYDMAKASGVPVPKMFQGGQSDLPVFTASGIDPKLLMQLPYRIRHAVAAEPDPAAVHGIFEEHAHQPDVIMPHIGLDDAIGRMSTWASTAGVNPQEDALKAGEQAADAKRLADIASLPAARRVAMEAAMAKLNAGQAGR
ncbi:MAG: hypothetical protein M3N95_04880 [Actinomycetota bacterium]|nr:hypothetical protein [Actinomycetota bacterium]